MLTAKWTAIGRRLSVRGRSDRPPASLGQVRHRQIVAPLAATALAGAAVVAGVAASRAGRARRRPDNGRPAGPRRRDRRRPAPAPRKAPARGGGAAAPHARADRRGDRAASRAPPARPTRRRSTPCARTSSGCAPSCCCSKTTSAASVSGARIGSSPASAAQLAQARDAEVMLATLDALIARHPQAPGAPPRRAARAPATCHRRVRAPTHASRIRSCAPSCSANCLACASASRRGTSRRVRQRRSRRLHAALPRRAPALAPGRARTARRAPDA